MSDIEKNKCTSTYQVRISTQEYQLLHDIAAKHGIKAHRVAVTAIREYLQKHSEQSSLPPQV